LEEQEKQLLIIKKNNETHLENLTNEFEEQYSKYTNEKLLVGVNLEYELKLLKLEHLNSKNIILSTSANELQFDIEKITNLKIDSINQETKVKMDFLKNKILDLDNEINQSFISISNNYNNELIKKQQDLKDEYNKKLEGIQSNEENLFQINKNNLQKKFEQDNAKILEENEIEMKKKFEQLKLKSEQ
jgi:hypothetical protein